jgi:hypothetical protein
MEHTARTEIWEMNGKCQSINLKRWSHRWGLVLGSKNNIKHSILIGLNWLKIESIVKYLKSDSVAYKCAVPSPSIYVSYWNCKGILRLHSWALSCGRICIVGTRQQISATGAQCSNCDDGKFRTRRIYALAGWNFNVEGWRIDTVPTID